MIYAGDLKDEPASVPATPAFATSTPLPGFENKLSTPATVNVATSSKVLHRNVNSTPLSSRENSHASDSAPQSYANGNGNGNIPATFDLSNFTNSLPINSSLLAKLLTDNRLANENDFTLGSSFEAKQAAPQVRKGYSQILIPFFLAIVVCFFIYFGLGDVVSNSLAIPFILYAVQEIVRKVFMEREVQNVSGMLQAAVMLCGVSPKAVETYSKVASLLDSVGSSFSVYFLTVILWQTFIGLPLPDVGNEQNI